MVMDRLSTVPESLDKLDNLERLEKVHDRLVGLVHIEEKVAGIDRKSSNIEQAVTDLITRGGIQTSRDPRDHGIQDSDLDHIHAQLKKIEGDIPNKLCEFGSMVEGLHQEVVKKVEKLSSKMGDGGGGGGGGSNPLLMPKLDDILKRVKRLENLNSAFADNDIKMIQ